MYILLEDSCKMCNFVAQNNNKGNKKHYNYGKDSRSSNWLW